MSTVISHLNFRDTFQNDVLHHALSMIPYMDLDWRKWLLDVCQTGLPIQESSRLQSGLATLYSSKRITTPDGIVELSTIKDICHLIATSRFSASFISIHLRSETALIDDGSDEVLRAGIMKEINASLNEREPIVNFEAILNLNLLSKQRWHPNYPITPSWVAGCNHFCLRLTMLMVDLAKDIIFPQVQRKKNMSTESCDNLAADGYEYRGRVDSLRTVDLEIHNFKTGKKTFGDNELRWAWKYNDLKPRAYYCSGATAYWKARYVKPIAVKFMESLPMTKASRRSYPNHIANMLEESDTVVIWDLESFTTSLSELRLFLWWAARLLENDPTVRQNPLRVFDYSEGIIQCNVWDLLDEYNEEVNCYSQYSLHRLIDDIGLDDMEATLSTSHMNSGPLGVAGNIGFSCTLHGLNTGSVSKTFNSAATIGDDVMAIIDEAMSEEELIEKVQGIGSIPRSKFGIFGPCEESEENNGWKFVKRPLRRWKQDIVLWEQLNIPILAYVYHVRSKNRKFFSENTADKTVHRFVGQVSDILWRIQLSTIDFQPGELQYLAKYLGTAYHALGIPQRGCLPGRKIQCGGTEVVMNYAVPCIDFSLYNPLDEDWAEYLWNSCPQSYAKLPIDAGTEILPEYDVDFVYGTDGGVMKVLQDLEYITAPKSQYEWVPVIDENYRRFKAVLHGDVVPLVTYRWLKFPPHWYDHFRIPRYTIGRSSLDEDMA